MNVQLQLRHTSTDQTLKNSQILLLNDNHKVLIYYIHPFLLRKEEEVSAFLTFQVRLHTGVVTSVPLFHALSICYSVSMLVSMHSLIKTPLLLSRDNATKERHRAQRICLL